MKRERVIGLSLCLILVLLLVGVSQVMAAKPQKAGNNENDVITLSNGFPSGEHETLNIHGKNESFVCEEPAEPGNVVNIPEYGSANITYVSGKKVNIDHLMVFDSCGDSFDGDPAEVWLPYWPDGYWVFARALGKPAKGDPAEEGYDPRRIIIENDDLSPTAYYLSENVSEPGDLEEIIPLGLITQNGAYSVNSTDEVGINLVRFDSEPEGKGRGKTQGKNITDMFMWTGWVFHPDLDVNSDNVVDETDVIADNCTGDTDHDGSISPTELQAWKDAYIPNPGVGYDANGDGDINELDVIADTCDYDINGDGDGVIDPDEFEAWLGDNMGDPEDPLWYHYETPVWVFTIADLVYHNQVYINEGIKNLQIRFYPKGPTQFTP